MVVLITSADVIRSGGNVFIPVCVCVCVCVCIRIQTGDFNNRETIVPGWGGVPGFIL